ncbi:MAG: type VII secretion integral membrane protein EccD, partial [Actinocatenispora sp.]
MERDRVPTAYSRVTVVSGSRRVDLALPSALPLSDVLPQVLRFCAPDETPHTPASWYVARVGGHEIALDQTLDDVGVVDGDLLELLTRTTQPHPAYVEDVRDAVEDAVDDSGRLWQPRTSLAFAFTAVAVGLAALPLLASSRQTGHAGSLVTAIVLAGALVGGTWFATARGFRWPPQLLAGTAVLWGGVAGWLAASWLDWPGPARYS